MVISTCNIHSAMPDDFIAACHTAHLSRLATSPTQPLSKHIWMVDSYPDVPSSFSGLLQLNLVSLPKSLLSKADHFTAKQFSILFSLVVIHTTVALQPKRGNELAPVHYSNLTTSINRLVSMGDKELDISTILHFLIELVGDLYSSCLQKEKMQNLAKEALTVDHSTPGAEYSPIPGVELTVPTINSTGKLANQAEKAVKVISAEEITK